MKIAIEHITWTPLLEAIQPIADMFKKNGIPTLFGLNGPCGAYFVCSYHEIQEVDPDDVRRFMDLPLPQGQRWCILPPWMQLTGD